MAVSNVVSAVIRLGDGIAVAFDFDIEAVSAASIKVGYIVGTTVVAAAPATYSVVMNGTLTGGVVTFTVAPVAATKIYIYRETDQTQVVSVSRQQAYNPAVVERVWDKLTLLIQELSTAVKRSVKTGPDANPDQLVNDLETARQQAVTSAAAADADATAAAISAAAAAASAAAADLGAGLISIKGLTTTADNMLYTTAADTYAVATLTAAGRALLDDADAAAMRTTLGTPATADIASTITATLASQAEAEAGANNTKLMTPLRTRDADTAFRDANDIGWRQTWQTVTGSRTAGTSYQNTTGRPLMAFINATAGSLQYLQVSPDNATWVSVGCTTGGNTPNTFVVPNGWYYRVTASTNVVAWTELR